MRPSPVIDCWRRPLRTNAIDGDYQDRRAFEFEGTKNWSSFVRILAVDRITAVTSS